MTTDRKPTCIACAGAGGGISEEEVIQLIEDNQLTAGNGIAVTDNKIDLKDFQLCTTNDWTTFFDNNVINADLYVIVTYGGMPHRGGTVFIPKGTPTDKGLCSCIHTALSRDTNKLIEILYLSFDSLNTNKSYIDILGQYLSYSDGTFTWTPNQSSRYNKIISNSYADTKGIRLYYRK